MNVLGKVLAIGMASLRQDYLTNTNFRSFHLFFVGKIVNMIRRFPAMRDDLIHSEFLTIPQYYRGGVICVSKKKPSPDQT